MKKLVALILSLCLLTGALTAAFAEAAPAEQQSRHYGLEYTFYVLDEDPDFMPKTLLFFFDGVDDLPWLDVEELCDILVSLQHRVFKQPDYDLTYEADENTVVLRRENNFYMVLNYDENQIAFNDYNAFVKDPTAISLIDQLSHTGFNDAGEPYLFQRDLVASFDRCGDVKRLYLGDYNIQLISENGRFYIPLQTANDFLFAPMFARSILFNGQAMFLARAQELFNFDDVEPTALGRIYYSAEPTQRSQELADFGYNELSLMMDSLYGMKKQHDIGDFGRMFWQIGFDEALDSTNPRDADQALKNFISYYLDDLHSAFSLASWMTGLEFIDSETGPSSRHDKQQTKKYEQLRKQGMGEDWQSYQEVGNTAYITFDEFFLKNKVDYYADGAKDELIPDTIGLIIYAHQQIYREGSPIENVVIDLSNNFGGTADAAVFLISWILGEAEISIEDTYTGAQSTLVYRADVNLDRQFDEQDTLADKHVYCLISPVSFSCGNLVPSVCKYHQAVTLIGRTSGGGACAVQRVSTAWGSMFQISGTSRLSFRKNGSFYDIDGGVEPDIYIDHLETLYDREALTNLINGLN